MEIATTLDYGMGRVLTSDELDCVSGGDGYNKAWDQTFKQIWRTCAPATASTEGRILAFARVVGTELGMAYTIGYAFGSAIYYFGDEHILDAMEWMKAH